MLDGHFIPGLVSFLLAHVAYIALFRRGIPWLPSRGAVLAVGLAAAAMLGVLWTGGLPAGLRAPVVAYVLAIGVMVAQAIGRASVLRDRPSVLVAVGAACFLVSDATLAINKFVTPLPVSAFWVLSSYYAAQCLIVAGMLRSSGARPVAPVEPAPAEALLTR